METEAIKAIINNPVALIAVITGIVIFLISFNNKRYLKIDTIKRKWLNRSFSNMEDILEDIIIVASSSMSDTVSKIQMECPQGSNCQKPQETLDLELLVYDGLVRDLFRGDIKNQIKRRILHNGFHNKSEVELDDYCTDKATHIYLYIVNTLSKRTKLVCPSLTKYIGSNFSIDQAIASYKQIIKTHLVNQEYEAEEIRDVDKEYFSKIFNKLKWW